MNIEKGKTYKYLREKRDISQSAKDNQKLFSNIKKTVLEALKEGDMTIEQITQKLSMPKDEVVFYVMTLVKYGHVKAGAVDDMDEYFTYKLTE